MPRRNEANRFTSAPNLVDIARKQRAWRIVFLISFFKENMCLIRTVDPVTTSLVFNCGAGVVRTTYAMVAASILRRKQHMLQGLTDPYLDSPERRPSSGTSTVGEIAYFDSY